MEKYSENNCIKNIIAVALSLLFFEKEAIYAACQYVL